MSFFKVYIEITNICGLSCSFCPPKLEKPSSMDLPLFEKIAKELHKKTKEITLHVMGDPLLHKELPSILDIAHKYEHKVSLVTSGFYLGKQDFNLLIKPAIKQLNISLNSFNKNSKKLELKAYMKSIFSFIDFKLTNRAEMLVNLRLWNLGDKDEFNEKVLSYISQKYDVKIDFNFTKKQSIRVAKYTRVHFDEYFIWPSLQNPVYPSSKCYGLNAQIAILADGRVVPCCLDYEGKINLGNIKGQDLNEILASSSKMAQDLKSGILTQELCQKCSYRLRFL